MTEKNVNSVHTQNLVEKYQNCLKEEGKTWRKNAECRPGPGRLLRKWLRHLPAPTIELRQLLLSLKLWKTIMPEFNTLRFMMTMTMLLLMMMMMMKKQLDGSKCKTRQAKALEDARKAPRTFLELLHEACLESLPPHVPSYLRVAVGPPSSTSRRHFCIVCGFTGGYMCVKCGMRFCSIRCQHIHDDTRCMKFVA